MKLLKPDTILVIRNNLSYMEFTQEVQDFLNENYPGVDIDNMSLEDLKNFREQVEEKREEFFGLEIAMKQLGNAAYGACANQWFYFYDTRLAADITGECRHLTKTMINNLENFFHEEIWKRKDLQEKFGFELDENKHDWYRGRHVWIYSDTDSNSRKSLLLIDKDNKMTIENLFNMCNNETNSLHISPSSKEVVLGNGHTVKNYKDGKIVDVPIKFVMRHHVTKLMYKIRTKSGKETIVTCDHSCVVFRNGKQLVVKAKDIKKTDKILSINHGKAK